MAGSGMELKILASGYDLGFQHVKGMIVNPFESMIESNFWLLPNPQFWNSDEPIIITSNRNYTKNDI